jgi:phage FluMu protein Com
VIDSIFVRKICAKLKEINGVTDETGATITTGASSRAEYRNVTPAEDAIPDRMR